MYEFLDFQVRDVMSRAESVAPEASLASVQRLLEAKGYNGVPVVDANGALVGWATTLDVLSAFRFTDDAMLPPYEQIMDEPISRFMVSEPATVTPRAPLTRVLEKMVSTRNKSFAVVDDDRLVGVVAREDVMRALQRAAAGERPGGDD